MLPQTNHYIQIISLSKLLIQFTLSSVLPQLRIDYFPKIGNGTL